MNLETMVHLRGEVDANGDIVEWLVYCGRTCYLNDYDSRPLAADGVAGYEEGGAWPCYEGADYAEYCAYCSRLVAEGVSA